MAKSKKPASNRKRTSHTPKVDAPTSDVSGTAEPKATETAASSKTSPAAATPDAKVSGTPKVDPAAKDVKPFEKPTPKPAEAKDTKVAADKPAPAKTDAKPTPAKAAETATKKPEPASTKPAAQSTPAKAEDKKPTASVPAKKPEPVKQPEKSASVFWPLVFGGIVAAGLGFAAAELNFLNTRPDLAAIQGTQADLQKQIAALAPADLSGLESGIAEVSEGVTGLGAQLKEIDTRLVAVEERPQIVAEEGESPGEAFVRELNALKASAEEQRDEIASLIEAAQGLPTLKTSVEELLENAQDLPALTSTVAEQKEEIARLLENALTVEEATADAAREAAIQAATAKLTAAFGSGEAYADVLDDLSAAGIADLPSGLTDPAGDGVATLLTLQTEFPDTARSALAAARETGVDAGTGGVGGFLKRQLGARSVAPRDGDDPDAVLSRAEAAVRSGQIADALTEIDALPTEVQGAMEAWLAQARTRAAAEVAVQDLSERLTAN